MCGIAGILDPSGVAPTEAREMASCLAHRGPDDATVYCDGPVGLGFRRLSIIDLDTGRQPIASEDGRVRVILNGEIYNYRQLRNELQGAGHTFSTTSDTEVLVHLYEDHGADLVDRLRGMFAFALWDEGRRRLLIARDHLGQKPLFWARRGERFWFASEIKSILAAEDTFRRPNLQALHEYFSIRVVSEDRSMFEGIHKLPAGHLLKLEPGAEPRIRRYWNLRYDPKTSLDEDEAVDALDARLREAVDLHLVADVEVATYLSGGIDSGLVTAMAAGLRDEPLRTFSVGTPYGQFDELPAARLVAERYGTRHEEATIRGEDISLLPRLVYHLDEPSDPLSVCQWRIAELAARRVKVVVGGDGGDELFGGYDRYYGAQYARYWAMLPRFVREGVIGRILDRVPDGFWYKSVSHRLRWLNELAGVESGRRYARSLSYFYFTPQYRDRLYTDDFRAKVEAFDPEAAIAFWLDEDRAQAALDQMLLADSMIRLPNHPVMILDRMSMAHGLEARSPFMDHELAEFAATLPVRMKVRRRQRRWIEMRLAERYLPAEVVNRPKQGFSSALTYMMGDEYEALFRHYLPGARLAEAGIVRPDAINDLLQGHLSGQVDHGNRLWLLLNAEIWWRVHLEQVDIAGLEGEMREIVGSGAARGRGGAKQGDGSPRSAGRPSGPRDGEGVRVAAVILTVDGCPDTLRCLDSLVRSGARSLAIVVLDNGSHDDTVEVIRRSHPEVAVLRSEENLGASGGRNRAAEEAIRRFDPEYLLFLDNDTEVRPGFLEPLVAELEADPSLGQTSPKLLLRSDPERIDMAGGADIVWWRGETTGRGRGELDRGQYDEPADCVAGGCTLVRTSAFREVGGFDVAFDPYGYEDMDFSLRLAGRGYGSRYVPESEILHANTQTFERGRYTLRYAARKARNWLIFLFRHGPVGARLGFFLAGIPWLLMRRVGRLLGLADPPSVTPVGTGGT